MAEHQLNVNPAELFSAAADLDKLADRLETTLGVSDTGLATPAAGRDEVSSTAAASFTAVTERFRSDAGSGVLELRKIAATLRAQATGYVRIDDEVTAAMRA